MESYQSIMLTESELSNLSPPAVRLTEARYFLHQFRAHCGPPVDRYFLMVAYADAFLVVLTSIEALVSEKDVERLRDLPAFRFAKTLRNITVHHDILTAPGARGKFGRPFRRVVEDSFGVPGDPSSSTLMAAPERLRQIFSSLLEERRDQKANIEGAMDFLDGIRLEKAEVPLEELFALSLSATTSVVDKGEVSPADG